MATQLVKVNEYDEFRSKVEEVKGACNFLPDVTTDEGYAKSKRVALDVGKVLTAVEKKRKELKKESLDFGRLIDSEAKSLAAELEQFQLPHKSAYKELDNLKKEREQRRKDELEERARTIRELPEAMQDSDSSGLKMALESLQVEECLDFYEFTEQALKARNASKESLAKMFAEKLKQEKDAAELAELRKKQAEQEQKDRDDRIAKEAAAKAIDQAAEAVRQREAAEAEAKRQSKLAEERRIEAEAQAKIAAEQAAENARMQAAADQKAKEAAEQAENEKREANKKHVGKIRKEAKESLMALGIDEAMAKKVVMAIHNGDIKNVSIKY
jgi:hypothetical protein